MRITTTKPNCWTGKDGYNDANRVGEAVLALLWLRNVATYDGWPERAADYRGGPS